MNHWELAKIHANKPPHYVKVDTLYNRLVRGYSLYRALNQKVTRARRVKNKHPWKRRSYIEMMKKTERSHK